MRLGTLILFISFSVAILFLAGPRLLNPSALPIERNLEPVVHMIRHFQKPRPDPDQVWTALDHSVQAKLYRMLAEREPSHRMVLDRTKIITGRIVEEADGHVVFAEQLGESGELSMAISRDRISSLKPYQPREPEISLRDVRLYQEFPLKRFYKRSPYTIITDESWFAVNRMVKQLQSLHAGFSEVMGPLIERDMSRTDIQLLFFSDVKQYEAYRRKSYGVGPGVRAFYNIGQDRLVVHHQRDADWVKEGRKLITEIEKEHRDQGMSEPARRQLKVWGDRERDRLSSAAGEMTRRLLRHEGTHQLAYGLGVQSPVDRGRAWVSEGIATYFESERPGGKNAQRRELLREEPLVPLAELLSLSRCNTAEQYAQAWSLIQLLMQPEYRSGFFIYLDQLRKQPGSFAATPQGELCQFLPVDSDELERRWHAYIQSL